MAEAFESDAARPFGGCNVTRPISSLIEQAGFELEWLENGYLKGSPKFGGFLYRGVARPSRS